MDERIAAAAAQFEKLLREQLSRQEAMEKGGNARDFSKTEHIVIGVVGGDGIGPIIIREARRVLEKLLRDELAAGRVELKEIKHAYPRNKLLVRSRVAGQIAEAFSGKLFSNDEVLLTLSDPSEKAAVMQSLAGRFDLDELRIFEPSLNDIFVEYTGDQEEER